MHKLLIVLLVVVAVWKFLTYQGTVTLGPGVMVSEAPLQTTVNPPKRFSIDEYELTELAKFRIKAKVLSKKNYHFGREAELSPVDLALGWQNMSDESVLEQIEISQSGRFYRWYVNSFPIPRKAIETQSANMHIIPSNKLVEATLEDIRQGDIVEITGSLVNVEAKDGWRWQSSLTRDDTGSGACELIWVEDVYITTR